MTSRMKHAHLTLTPTVAVEPAVFFPSGCGCTWTVLYLTVVCRCHTAETPSLSDASTLGVASVCGESRWGPPALHQEGFKNEQEASSSRRQIWCEPVLLGKRGPVVKKPPTLLLWHFFSSEHQFPVFVTFKPSFISSNPANGSPSLPTDRPRCSVHRLPCLHLIFRSGFYFGHLCPCRQRRCLIPALCVDISSLAGHR